MRILFDYQAFTMQKFGGVSKCFCELIANMPDSCKCEIGVKESDNFHLLSSPLIKEKIDKPKLTSDSFLGGLQFRGKGRIYSFMNKFVPNFPSVEKTNQAYSIELLKNGDYDIFHPTFFNSYYLKYLGKKPFVLTIHDMMPELFPQYFKRNDFQILAKKKLVDKAAAIVAVSNQTKNDIIDILGVSPDKIHVVYHGAPQINDCYNSSLFDFPYYLYMGTRSGYKNFIPMLVDFAEYWKKGHNEKLICTGPIFTADELAIMHQLDIADKVIHYRTSDQDISSLYANAIAFVYPSLYEGFGMPILEAFTYGCPVLLNNKSCFPEIAGNAALYFNSDGKESDLCNTLETFSSYSSKEREALIDKGYERNRLFSWKKSAAKLADLYQSIL